MRVLVASTAGTGHFGPLVPFAHALRDAGHEVAVAAPESFADDVARAGLTHHPFDDAPAERLHATFAALPSLPVGEADRVVVREVFGRLDAQAALPGVRADIDRWRPDLVLREPAELGSLAAAEAAGVPHVTVTIGMTRVVADMAAHLAEPLAELDALAGLPSGRCAAASSGAPLLSGVPATLDAALGAPPAAPYRFRVDHARAEAELPRSWGDPDAPLVYVTFGSVAAGLGPFRTVYRRAVDVLADAPYRVLLTTGSALTPADLGPLPANTHVEQWWPQASVMPATAAMVGHGGFGTTMSAIAHGVPQAVLPLFSFDQFLNADHVAAVGAGVRVDGGPDGVEGLPSALGTLVASPRPRAAAAALAAEVAALPPLAEAALLLEELCRRAA
jgi:UDP-N-acetylglucosamine:LPS N-acetylglucosamine transferase